ncbi:glycoside hydrolase family 2 TIM barrel-domain containing protein [Murimonas intestini]|uniref:glycoside hydrolase family 2 TIM barrel-domain containing protein n=1 Tax=Murimonas intestini TaxID=1337051 RepID=UPI0011DE1554|nr:glycoside hydrolase family 2 TIM barrel-domain containing protein [Murimonas intestini]
MKKERINDNWMFWKDGHETEKQLINLPHDAMLTEERVPDLPNGNATGFYPGGKYIYTKNLFGTEALREKSVSVEFEGVYMNSKVFLNEEEVGGWIYGYTNFYVDLTDRLKIGEDNELKVIVDNSETPNSRWYSGSGIYRSVNLWTGEKHHIKPEGIKIKTVSINPAEVEVSIEAEKPEDMTILCEVLKDGKIAASFAGEYSTVQIPNGKLWDAEHPELYTLKAVLKNGDGIVDEAQTRFGIRMITWGTEKGFQINGNTVKLRGGCIHHDHGPLGACAYDKAEYRRVKKLKEAGFNAVRYSHNPAGKNFLDVCDELGMYVLDETFDQWELSQSPHDYSQYFAKEWKKDVTALVSKDYNHPCVVMYCIGNEITDTGLPSGAEISRMLNEAFHQLDSTRPTTIAVNSMLSVLAAKQAEKRKAGEKNVGSEDVNDILTLLPKIMASITPENLETLIGECISYVDIPGYNYGHNLYEGTHKLAPKRLILSTETFPKTMDTNWAAVEQNDYVIGDFMWTAWDYLGEAGVGLPVYGTTQAPFSKDYPCLTAACGSFDLTGFPESQAYYSAVMWGAYDKPYIGVRPVNHSGEEYTLGRWRLTDSLNCWTWPGQEGREAEIEVYSIGDSVELFQDGQSMGRKPLEAYKCDFHTAYRPGVLEAVCYDSDGKEIARDSLVTAGEETRLTILKEDDVIRADGEDLAYVTVYITDEKGNLKMMTNRKISVTVEGPGRLLAVGSGNPETEEKFTDGVYTSWHGRVIAIIRSEKEAGRIKVTASAEGMESVSAEIMSDI